MFSKARENFESEIDIVDFLKRIRRLEAFKKESFDALLKNDKSSLTKHDMKLIVLVGDETPKQANDSVRDE